MSGESSRLNDQDFKRVLRSQDGELLPGYEKPLRQNKQRNDITVDSGLGISTLANDSINLLDVLADISGDSEANSSQESIQVDKSVSIKTLNIKKIIPTEEHQIGDNIVGSLTQNNTNTMAQTLSNNQLISLKDAISCIPLFEGKPGELFDFIQNCEEAKDVLPEAAEENLAKLVQRKCLSQSVKASLNNKKFTKVAEIIKALKAIYTPIKTEWQLQGELGSIFQKENDTVVIFSNKLRKKGQEIVELFKVNNPECTDEQLTACKNKISENIKECFLQGLKSDIDQRMPICATMHDAYDKAIEIERKLNAKSELRGEKSRSSENKKTEDKSDNSKPVKFVKMNQNLNQGNRNNGTSKKNFNGNNGGNEQNNLQKSPGNSGVKCQICGKLNHSARTCFQRSNNTNVNNSGCQICQRTNHTAKTCFLLKNNSSNISKSSENQLKCQLCENIGHTADKCRGGSNQSNSGGNKYCAYCKLAGHIMRDCWNLQRKNSGNRNSSFPSGAGRDATMQRPVTVVQEIEQGESGDDFQ